MTAIRNGIIVLLACALPATASAGCGPFSPCGSPSWFGFSLALPVPRLPHLHTFCSHGPNSPMCGMGHPVGSCLFGHGCGLQNPCGCCPTPGIGPSYVPPLSSPPILSPQPTFPPTSCNPCDMGFAHTQLVPQQTITYREVPQIQYRQETYTEQVPVTTFQQVTRMRSVPYQTMTRIPQISTQYVPQISSAPCNPCLSGLTTTPFIDSGMPMYSPTPSMQPQMNGVPEYPYPATQPQADAGGWQTIPQRQADGANVQQMGYFPQAAPQPTRRQSMFQPAPSAATAWQSRFLR
jgi:hypothetical protein